MSNQTCAAKSENGLIEYALRIVVLLATLPSVAISAQQTTPDRQVLENQLMRAQAAVDENPNDEAARARMLELMRQSTQGLSRQAATSLNSERYLDNTEKGVAGVAASAEGYLAYRALQLRAQRKNGAVVFNKTLPATTLLRSNSIGALQSGQVITVSTVLGDSVSEANRISLLLGANQMAGWELDLNGARIKELNYQISEWWTDFKQRELKAVARLERGDLGNAALMAEAEEIESKIAKAVEERARLEARAKDVLRPRIREHLLSIDALKKNPAAKVRVTYSTAVGESADAARSEVLRAMEQLDSLGDPKEKIEIAKRAAPAEMRAKFKSLTKWSLATAGAAGLILLEEHSLGLVRNAMASAVSARIDLESAQTLSGTYGASPSAQSDRMTPIPKTRE